ncbi:hypothetical protein MBANPS3_005649, partial [Mucor bainieri]
MMQKQSNSGSIFLLVTAVFLLLLEVVHCVPYKLLDDCPKNNVILQMGGENVAFLELIKYPGSTGTRFEFFTGGFQLNKRVCLYSDNNPVIGEFYNTVMPFSDSQSSYSIRIGNTNSGVYLYYSWDNFNFSCDASRSGEALPQVILNYGGKNEVVTPIRYICKANNGFEKKKRSVVEKKLQ